MGESLITRKSAKSEIKGGSNSVVANIPVVYTVTDDAISVNEVNKGDFITYDSVCLSDCILDDGDRHLIADLGNNKLLFVTDSGSSSYEGEIHVLEVNTENFTVTDICYNEIGGIRYNPAALLLPNNRLLITYSKNRTAYFKLYDVSCDSGEIVLLSSITIEKFISSTGIMNDYISLTLDNEVYAVNKYSSTYKYIKINYDNDTLSYTDASITKLPTNYSTTRYLMNRLSNGNIADIYFEHTTGVYDESDYYAYADNTYYYVSITDPISGITTKYKTNIYQATGATKDYAAVGIAPIPTNTQVVNDMIFSRFNNLIYMFYPTNSAQTTWEGIILDFLSNTESYSNFTSNYTFCSANNGLQFISNGGETFPFTVCDLNMQGYIPSPSIVNSYSQFNYSDVIPIYMKEIAPGIIFEIVRDPYDYAIIVSYGVKTLTSDTETIMGLAQKSGNSGDVIKTSIAKF